MLKRFYLSLRAHLRGNNVGLQPDFHLIGEKPFRKNRAQRRAEKFGK